MRIIADRNMPFAAEAFGTLGETLIRDGRSLTAADVREADILAIRSTTQVNAALLDGSRVRFVGTATIGTDHMDIPYLESHGIGWCFSPGCNANSVSEYFTAALLHLAVTHGFSLAGKTVGVIGVGNVGSRVVGKARALGMTVLMNDPPRQRAALAAGRDAEAAEFVDLPTLLAASDIVTVHVPMEKGGSDPTFHLADGAFFARMRPGAIFINAARGAVADSPALLAAIDSGKLAHVVLDTWEGEPGGYRDDLLARVDIATPHIAGHSFEGKVGGTEMVYQAVCKFLGREPTWTAEGNLPPPPVPSIEVSNSHVGRQPARIPAEAGTTNTFSPGIEAFVVPPSGGSAHNENDWTEVVLHSIVRQVYDIMGDDARMRQRAAEVAKAAHFDHLRKNYPMRREFRFTEVACEHADAALKGALRALGFRLAP